MSLLFQSFECTIYIHLGSGSLAAMAVFEKGFKPNMEVGDNGL